jgi:DNA-binding transcriptional regulator YhcF (GntR family)
VLIEVDTMSPTPAYEQIRAQVETMVSSGILGTGDPLPTIRQLAADLGLAVNTVARAYRELESTGTVKSRVRHGTVIADRPRVRLQASETRRRLADAAGAYALVCRQLGVSVEEAVSAVRTRLT